MNLDIALQVALLHDVLEDTDTNYEELKTVIGSDVAIAVQCLTKDKEMPKEKQTKNS